MITCSIASECHGALANANKDFISNWYPFHKLQAYFTEFHLRIHVLRETSIASKCQHIILTRVYQVKFFFVHVQLILQ